MHYLELITSSASSSASASSAMLEARTYSFPGYGQHLFRQAFYQYTGEALWQIQDPAIQEWMTDWISALFAHDNSGFKPDRFKAFVAKHGVDRGSAPTFQQRHLHYLAHEVAAITDPHIRRFASDWMAALCRRTNHDFKPERWKKFAEPEPAKAVAAKPSTVDEARGNPTGAPGYGPREHGGFGKKFFQAPHYTFIAAMINQIRDVAIRQHVADWFAVLFRHDNPAFNGEQFREAITQWGSMNPPPRFQQRHFYYLAHEIAATEDSEIRNYLCEWLGRKFDSINDNFLFDRWRKYCHLTPTDPDQQRVQRRRAAQDLVGQSPDDSATARYIEFDVTLPRGKLVDSLPRGSKQITATVWTVESDDIEALQDMRRALTQQKLSWTERPSRLEAKHVDPYYNDEKSEVEEDVTPYPTRTKPRASALAQADGSDPYLHEYGWRRAADARGAEVYRHPKDPAYKIRKKQLLMPGRDPVSAYHLHGLPDAISNHTLISSHFEPHLAHQAFLRHSNSAAARASDTSHAGEHRSL